MFKVNNKETRMTPLLFIIFNKGSTVFDDGFPSYDVLKHCPFFIETKYILIRYT